ncbi:MAG: 50S ribosomal protein L24 [Clostridiales bacterium]|nr:50S ribosomal protein L24 [Clostridiales bacterium]
MKLKKGDNVVVTAGKDKGRRGKVLEVNRKTGGVLVESVNMVSRHTKPRQGAGNGGIIKKEAPLHVSNVMYLHKGNPTRIGYKLETGADGKITKKRIAKSTGEEID